MLTEHGQVRKGLTTMLNFAINNEAIQGGVPIPLLTNNPNIGGIRIMANLSIPKNQSRKQDYIGRKFGRLTIIKNTNIVGHVECLCDCGNRKTILLASIKSGHTKSCGCLHKEQLRARNTTHGKRHHPVTKILYGMRSRCLNAKDKQYKDYGGRGIKICKEWEDVATFFNWAIDAGWKPGLNIDRKDPNGDYEPCNCRFVDDGLNSRNTRLLRVDNASGYRGVSFKKKNNKWVAQISINSKRFHIGLFETAIEAAKAYDLKAKNLNAGYPLNFKEN